MTEFVQAISPAVVSASAVVIVMVLTPMVTSHRRRRDSVNDKLDAAVASLHKVNAGRFSNQDIASGTYIGTEAQRLQFKVEIQEESLRRYIAAVNDARSKLAEIANYVPGVAGRLNENWEITEAEVSSLIAQIEGGRTSAVRSERMIRRRKYPDSVSL
ncbi:hypothetical protein [Brevibacterium aurantiacum]|uniref:hypothetical protein n=1 Tax=Brevibacterium aurantiacum TaxID=273384 RepID=UPI001868E922|nr:hypothetical protein [Brevibacterium aurantiacum]